MIGIAKDNVPLIPAAAARAGDSEVDFLGKKADGSFVHIELQNRNDPAMALRMFAYLIDIAVITAPSPKGWRKLPLPRIQQKVIFIGPGKPDMESFIVRKPDLSYRFQIMDSKNIDGGSLLESEFITDVISAVICRRKRPEIIRRS